MAHRRPARWNATEREAILVLSAFQDTTTMSLYRRFFVAFATDYDDLFHQASQSCFEAVVIDTAFAPAEDSAIRRFRARYPWILIVLLDDSMEDGAPTSPEPNGIVRLPKRRAEGTLDHALQRLLLTEADPATNLFTACPPALFLEISRLYTQAHDWQALEGFAEHLVDLVPGLVVSLFYEYQESHRIFSVAPLTRKLLSDLTSGLLEVATAPGRPSPDPRAVHVDYRGGYLSGSQGEPSFELVCCLPCETGAHTRASLAVWQPPSGRPLFGTPTAVLARTIHQALLSADHIRRRANNDPVTDLLSAQAFMERLSVLYKLARDRAQPLGLALIDIDRFDVVNQYYGRRIGDDLLRQVADRIRAQLRPKDCAARLNADTFAVIVWDPDDDRLSSVTQSLVTDIHEYDFACRQASIRLTVSAGAIHSGRHNERDETDLLAMAESALRVAKANGRNQWVPYKAAFREPYAVEQPETLPLDGEEPSEPCVVIVDDDERILSLLERAVQTWGLKGATFQSAPEALAYIEQRPRAADVVLTDIVMPEMNGAELAERIRTIDPNVVLVAMTGAFDSQRFAEIVRAGFFDLIPKPFTVDLLRPRILQAVEHRRLKKRSDVYRDVLEARLNDQRLMLERQIEHLESAYWESLEAVAVALDLYHPSKRTAHAQRVALFSNFLARKIAPEDTGLHRAAYAAGLFHDIGTLAQPPPELPMDRHPNEREKDALLKHIGFTDRFMRVAPILHDAHASAISVWEWFDGSGLPQGLREEAIPLGGRIAALADAFDRERYDRQDRRGDDRNEVVKAINELAGRRFDPEVVQALNNAYLEMDQLFMIEDRFWESMDFDYVQ